MRRRHRGQNSPNLSNKANLVHNRLWKLIEDSRARGTYTLRQAPELPQENHDNLKELGAFLLGPDKYQAPTTETAAEGVTLYWD